MEVFQIILVEETEFLHHMKNKKQLATAPYLQNLLICQNSYGKNRLSKNLEKVILKLCTSTDLLPHFFILRIYNT